MGARDLWQIRTKSERKAQVQGLFMSSGIYAAIYNVVYVSSLVPELQLFHKGDEISLIAMLLMQYNVFNVAKLACI